MTTAIVSYDGTLNDEDALGLASVLRAAGLDLILAYVRHATQPDSAHEVLEEHEAAELLERGARWLGDLEVQRRVVVHASTGEGLRTLAEQSDAQLLVFGSDYRTAAGHVQPQASAQRLLEGGHTSVALAPAGYGGSREHEIRSIGLLADLDDHAAIDTAHALASHYDATVTENAQGVDLLIVGSRPEAGEGRVLVSAQSQNAIENASCPVLVVARGALLHFRSPLYLS